MLTFMPSPPRPPLEKIPPRVGATVIHVRSRCTGLLYERRGNQAIVRYYRQAAAHESSLLSNFYTHEIQHSAHGWAHILLEECDREIAVPPWVEPRLLGKTLFLNWLGAIFPKPNSRLESDWFEVQIPESDGAIQAIKQLEYQGFNVVKPGQFF